MYDELQWHLYMSLDDIRFLRDFMRRTSVVDAIDELGWAYGYDEQGYGMLEEYQLNTLLSVLSNLEGHVGAPDFDRGTWVNTRTELPLSDEAKRSVYDEPTLCIRLEGDADELNQWRHFLQWQCKECMFMQDTLQSHTLGEILFPSFYWIVPMDIMSTLGAWEVLLQTWEVMTFYDNIANASAWRRLRTGDCITDDTGELATTRNHE